MSREACIVFLFVRDFFENMLACVCVCVLQVSEQVFGIQYLFRCRTFCLSSSVEFVVRFWSPSRKTVYLFVRLIAESVPESTNTGDPSLHTKDHRTLSEANVGFMLICSSIANRGARSFKSLSRLPEFSGWEIITKKHLYNPSAFVQTSSVNECVVVNRHDHS